MPEAVTLLPAPLPAAAQAPEPAAAAQANAADAAAATPFPQALAQQLAHAAQADAKGSARAAVPVAGAANTASPLPPDGDALPLTLPPELTQAARGSTVENELAHNRAPTPADALQTTPLINVALPAAMGTPPVPAAGVTPLSSLPTEGNGTDRAGSDPLAYATASNAGGNPNDAALTTLSLRAREDAFRASADAQAAVPSDPGGESNMLASGVLAAVAAPAREATAAMLASQQEIKSAQAAGGSDATSIVPSALTTAAHELRTPRTETPMPMQISLPLQDPNWAQAAGQRVLWMVKNETQSAELRINPPDLGPVELRVTLNGNDQASVSFASPHAGVREALEAAFPRLRDMLGANGLVLADVNVSAQTFAEQRQSPDYRGGAWQGLREANADGPGEVAQAQAQSVRTGTGLLDLYA